MTDRLAITRRSCCTRLDWESALDIGEYYKRYAETLLAVDESLGRRIEHLKRRGELDSTLIVYMGDNGLRVRRTRPDR